MKHFRNVECKDITHNRKFNDITTSYTASIKKASLICQLYAVKSVAYVRRFSGFPTKVFCEFFCRHYESCEPPVPSWLIKLPNTSSIWWRVQIMLLLVTKLLGASNKFLHFNFFSNFFFKKNSQFVPPLMRETTIRTHISSQNYSCIIRWTNLQPKERDSRLSMLSDRVQ
jgi:hypothetical protein